jgi:hypothetical protein
MAEGLNRFEKATGGHVCARRESLTVTALQVQDRLVYARFNHCGDAALPCGDALEASGVAPRLRDGPANINSRSPADGSTVDP